jgi:hypothetical protein
MNGITRRLTSFRRKAKKWRHHVSVWISRWGESLIAFTFAVALFGLGAVLVDAEDRWSHFVSIIFNIASIFLAACLGLIWFERRERERAQKIEQAVASRVKLLRAYIASPLTLLTQVLFNEPEGYNGADVGYVERNYDRLRELLDMPADFQTSPFSDTSIRSRNLDWLIKRFLELSKYVDNTVRLFGPGLIEHGALLEVLEKLESGINGEWDRWQRWKVRDERLVPAEALLNLATLGQISMTAVASITLILQDWKTMPLVSDAELSRFAPPTY